MLVEEVNPHGATWPAVCLVDAFTVLGSYKDVGNLLVVFVQLALPLFNDTLCEYGVALIR